MLFQDEISKSRRKIYTISKFWGIGAVTTYTMSYSLPRYERGSHLPFRKKIPSRQSDHDQSQRAGWNHHQTRETEIIKFWSIEKSLFGYKKIHIYPLYSEDCPKTSSLYIFYLVVWIWSQYHFSIWFLKDLYTHKKYSVHHH